MFKLADRHSRATFCHYSNLEVLRDGSEIETEDQLKRKPFKEPFQLHIFLSDSTYLSNDERVSITTESLPQLPDGD